MYREGQNIAGGYTLKRKVGVGGFGEVWQALDEDLERDVAIKFILNLPETEETSRVVTEEGRILSQLSSSDREGSRYIVYVNKFFPAQEGTHPFLDLEWMEGGSLTDLLKTGVPLPQQRIIEIALHLIQALNCAHSSGIIHYDIKPSNVLLRKIEGGYIYKLSDFGLARKLGELTRGSWGTPPYMSPEQFYPGRKPGAASDIYSLGVMLYQCVAGHLPFRAEGMKGYRSAHGMSRVPPIDNHAVGSDLKALILDCLKKRPEERPKLSDIRSRLSTGRPVPPRAPPTISLLESRGGSAERPMIFQREAELEFFSRLPDGNLLPSRLITNDDYYKFVNTEQHRKWKPAAVPVTAHDGGYLESWYLGKPLRAEASLPVSCIPYPAAQEFAGWLGGRLPESGELDRVFSGEEENDFSRQCREYMRTAGLPFICFWCNDFVRGNERLVWRFFPDSPLADALKRSLRPPVFCLPHYLVIVVIPYRTAVGVYERIKPDYASQVSQYSGGKSAG